MREYEVIQDKRTLKALEKRGFICEPRHDVFPRCDEGQNYQGSFEYKGNHYSLKYFDGCFYPYLVKSISASARAIN